MGMIMSMIMGVSDGAGGGKVDCIYPNKLKLLWEAYLLSDYAGGKYCKISLAP